MKTLKPFLRKQIAGAKPCIVLVLIFASALSITTFGQKRLVLMHNGQTSVYSNFDSLKAHIQTGDTIYFPGAGYNINDWSINKSVTIFGAGHYPDSTVATGTTYLTGNIILKTGASNTFIQGLYLTGNVTFGSDATNQTVNTITISRCNINDLRLSHNGSAVTTSNNIVIRDNVIRGGAFMGGYATNVMVVNNIIQSVMQHFDNTLFKNNIHMRSFCGGGPLIYINNSSFQNNVMIYNFGPCSGQYFMNNCNTNDFQNNAFNNTVIFPDGSNTGSGNWNAVNLATFFVNQSGWTFSYSHNYHLQAPGTYLGTDGTQIGIYGSTIPYKDGAVPINPHIQMQTIAPTTNTNGELNINIKVAAQNN